MLALERYSESVFRDFENINRISCFGDDFDYECGDSLHSGHSPKNQSKMPVDMSAYLMSSSPPGFGLYNALGVNAFAHYTNAISTPLKPILSKPSELSDDDSDRNLKNGSPVCVCYSCQSQNEESTLYDDCYLFATSLNISDDVDVDDDDSDSDDDDDEIVSECRRLSVEDSADSSENEISQARIPVRSHRRKKFSKRVSFADCRGYSLTEVRIMTESSDSPPNIRPQFLSSLTDGALPGVTEIPPLKLEFKQPASDYYAFREKLKHQSVCLENVILKDYNVLGTVKVRNYSFEKSVHLRVSFDSWNSHTEVKANYVPNGDDSGALQYDTFAFEIRVPATLTRNQSVEFCVHYRCDCGEFWDNNDGNNYHIVTVDYNAPAQSMYTKDFRPNFSGVEVWSEYSSWHFNNDEVRYY